MQVKNELPTVSTHFPEPELRAAGTQSAKEVLWSGESNFQIRKIMHVMFSRLRAKRTIQMVKWLVKAPFMLPSTHLFQDADFFRQLA